MSFNDRILHVQRPLYADPNAAAAAAAAEEDALLEEPLPLESPTPKVDVVRANYYSKQTKQTFRASDINGRLHSSRFKLT